MQSLLGVLLSSNGETTEEFIDRYRSTCAVLLKETGNRDFHAPDLSAMTVTRWRNGGLKGIPRRPAPVVLQRMFPGRTVLELLTSADRCAPPPPVTGYTLNEGDLEMDARRAAERASQAAASNVEDMTIDEIEDDTFALASDYHTTPPFAVYGRANTLLATATGLLEQTKILTQQERLYRAAGQAAAVLATASFDLGSTRAATGYARTAAMYAKIIEDGALRAYALGNLAILAYWSGRPAQAVRHVEEARSISGLGDTACRRLAAISARAYAHVGDAGSARLAAEEALIVDTGSRDDLHDGVGGEFGFSRRRALMSNATTHLLIDDGEAAAAAAQEAIDLMLQEQTAGRLTPQEVTDLAQAAIDLGRARLLASEFDGAIEAVSPVFDLGSEWRVEGVTHRSAALRKDLARPDLALPQRGRVELAEKIEDYTRVVARSQLGTLPAIG
ncbi:hypothetical protein [Kitasatospora sp. NPDC089509]|uniref:hypothetical protein n=1 Tax=Kitasatospora sp. NPDC089509 TaxID=3364079 RepID=UPI0037F56395